MPPKRTDRVLLLHGLALGRRSMRPLERALQAAGYATLNLAYPSCQLLLHELVQQVHSCGEWIRDDGGALHLVTYSMGGLLARAAIAQRRPARLGRVVMLAPPNGGSEIADLLGAWAPYRRVFRPAGVELGTNRSDGLVRLLGQVDYPLGIIAGDRFLDPLGWLLIPARTMGGSWLSGPGSPASPTTSRSTPPIPAWSATAARPGRRSTSCATATSIGR